MLRLLVLFLSAGPLLAADPPKPVVVVSRTAVVPTASKSVLLDPWSSSQRYVALLPTTKDTLTYDYSDPSVVEVLTRQPNEKFFGVPFDAPAGSKSVDLAHGNALGPVAIITGVGQGSCTVTVWGVTDGKAVKLDTILIQVGPQPPPPLPPDPIKPDPVVPPAVKSFRVIFVTDSAKLLTAEQNAVINAKTTRDYLNAHCTKEKDWPDWRGYEPTTTTSTGYAGMDGLWAASKPKLTAIPCMIVQVNDKAEIVPFPANADECLKTLQSYGGK